MTENTIVNMTNDEVAKFPGTNKELCEKLGKFASPDSPPHFYNFTSKSLRDRAKILVAEGRGNDVFEIKNRRKSQSPAANQSATALVQLPQNLMALLPALHLMLQSKGHDLDCGLKQWVLNESTPASIGNESTPASIGEGCEAILPDEVVEFLGMFGMDTDENERMLLAYAGVKTLRSIRIERIRESIKVLCEMKVESLTDDRLETLERLILSFALTDEVSEE